MITGICLAEEEASVRTPVEVTLEVCVGILKASHLYVGLAGDRNEQCISPEHAVLCGDTLWSGFIGTALSLLPQRDMPCVFCFFVIIPSVLGERHHTWYLVPFADLGRSFTKHYPKAFKKQFSD